MKKTSFAIVTAVVLALVASGCENVLVNRDMVFQTSTISALMHGVYDGEMTIEELQFHGSLGVGTFNRLDGEMIVCGHAVYRINSAGVAEPITEEMLDMKTPFAMVTFFEPDESVAIHGLANLRQLKQHVDNFIKNPNALYAVRIEGMFRYLKLRSIPAQSRPYRELPEVVADVEPYEFRNVHGTIVGFRLPAYVSGVSVPGYYFNFITADRTRGGHVLDCELEGLNVELDYARELQLMLPENEMFARIPSEPAGEAEITAIK